MWLSWNSKTSCSSLRFYGFFKSYSLNLLLRFVVIVNIATVG